MLMPRSWWMMSLQITSPQCSGSKAAVPDQMKSELRSEALGLQPIYRQRFISTNANQWS